MSLCLPHFLFSTSNFSAEKISLRNAYEKNGIVYLSQFFDRETLQSIDADLATAEAMALEELAQHWNHQRVRFFSKNPVQEIKPGVRSEDFVVTPYFQRSAQAVHLFFEEIEGKEVVNRIGHGLHLEKNLPHLQGAIYRNEALQVLLQALGYRHPRCLMSTYIPKYPNGEGSEVRPHQESTFAHTDPLSALVLWIALEDATVENACLWGLPGSHRLPLKFISCVDHERKTRDYRKINEVAIPAFDPAAGQYQPLEVKAGDALCFHGNFVHCSPRNLSPRSRKALTFQFIDTAGVVFSPFNWIQRQASPRIY